MAATVDTSAIVEQWVRLSNAQDVDALLEHFAPDVTFSSPVAAQGHGTYLVGDRNPAGTRRPHTLSRCRTPAAGGAR